MGYTPQQVGEMTVDQVLLLLCDRDLLKRDTAGRRVQTARASALKKDGDGLVGVRTEDGQTVRRKFVQKSMVQMAKERQAEREAAAKKKRKRRGRK